MSNPIEPKMNIANLIAQAEAELMAETKSACARCKSCRNIDGQSSPRCGDEAKQRRHAATKLKQLSRA